MSLQDEHSPNSEVLVEVDRLMAALDRDDISADEIERLQFLVRTDSTARDRYVRGMMLKASLEWNGKGPTFVEGVLKSDTASSPPDANRARTPETHPADPLSAPIPAYFPPQVVGIDVSLNSVDPPASSPILSRWLPIHGWLLQTGFTVFLVLLCSVGFLAFRKNVEKESQKSENLEIASEKHGGAMSNIVQSGLPLSPNHSERLPIVGGLEMESGTAKLYLEGIGYVVLDSDADFRLTGPLRAKLNKGRVRVHVTEKTGHGFTVETPYGNVTDLGTEFGLDVPENGSAGVVVFDGAVDLHVAEPKNPAEFSRTQRLVRGEGVLFGKSGQMDRMMSIVTGEGATFRDVAELVLDGKSLVITDVRDNQQAAETKKFYEIVPGGLREDAPAYVDRVHQWNDVSSKGMPHYLQGADYIKTFNDNKLQDRMEISVTLGKPAKLYVFLDNRLPPPVWLKNSFRNTGDVIGSDIGPWGTHRRHRVGKGAGTSIDERFTIWERIVTEPGTVTLGPNMDSFVTRISSMYGIAAVELPSPQAGKPAGGEQQ